MTAKQTETPPIGTVQDVTHCDECGDTIFWTDATHRSFGVYCDIEQCEINGRRKHDGLPVEKETFFS